jgi:hypothetical protein
MLLLTVKTQVFYQMFVSSCATYGLDLVPDLDPEPELEQEPKLF